jgi:hypothetical protein
MFMFVFACVFTLGTKFSKRKERKKSIEQAKLR